MTRILFALFLMSASATCYGTSTNEIFVYKSEVFCGGKIVKNWRQDFSHFCNKENGRLVVLNTQRSTPFEFIDKLNKFIRNDGHYEKGHIVRVQAFDEKQYGSILDACIKDDACRVSRTAETSKKFNQSKQ